MRFVGYLFLCILFSSQGFSEELLRSTTSWDGGAIEYPDGDAEIIAVKLSLKKGVLPPYHCHPIPTMGYVSSGVVEVETKAGRNVVLKEGDSVVEVMRTVHRGRAITDTAEIIVFYASAVGMPHTVVPEDDSSATYCNEARPND